MSQPQASYIWETSANAATERQKLKIELTILPIYSCLLFAECPSNMLVYLRDGSVETSLRAATLR